MISSFLLRWLCTVVGGVSLSSWGYDIPISISGEITIPACIVNGGNVIDVYFGNALQTTRVNDGNYTQNIEYSVKCLGGVSNNLRMKIKGEPSNFNSSLLKTSNVNLGVLLKKESSPLPINEWVSFSYGSKLPSLQATLFSRSGEELSAGEFYGTATLIVDYQ